MWTYRVKEGLLLDPQGKTVCGGYSGNGSGLNNPDMEHVPDHGPIPRGRWVIGEFFDDWKHKGPDVCHLSPAPETETHGRLGFMIHGDNREENHTASEGCIILPRFARNALKIGREADNVLVVE